MARRFHCIPRGWRIDSFVASLRRDLADTSLRLGKKSCLTVRLIVRETATEEVAEFEKRLPKR